MEQEKLIENKEIEDNATYYYNLFQEALDFHKPRFDEHREMVAYYELQQDHLRPVTTKPWVYQINTPYATDAINLRVASLQASDYSGELEPLSPEDVKSIEQLNRAQKEFWREMDMDTIIDDSIRVSAVSAEAYTHVVFDSNAVKGGTNRKNKGKLKAYMLDSPSVHIDPKAFSLMDADYVCVTERVTKQKIKRQYPNFSFETLKGVNSVDERGEVYANSDYNTNQEGKVFNKITIYEKVESGVEKTVLLERSILEATEKMTIRCFPIAQLKWQKRLKSPYATSLMQMLLPLQKVLNEIESANANANMQYSSPSYVISEDSGIDPEELALSAGAPAAVYVVSGGVPIDNVIKPLIPDRGIDDGLVMTKQELERSIYKLAGITDEFQGEFGSAGNTSGGADLAFQRSKVIEQMILSNIQEYVEALTRIIVEFIVQGYAGDIIYARGEKTSTNQYKFEQFEIPENADELEYNFSVELSVRTQYSKDRQKQQIRELFEVERQYDTGDPKVLTMLDMLKALEIPQRDEFVDRFEHLAKMDANQRAQLVTEIILTSQELGIDAELSNGAVMEVIMNAKETPMIDQFIMVSEQTRIEQQNAANQVVNAATAQSIEQERIAQEPTGDEEFSTVK